MNEVRRKDIVLGRGDYLATKEARITPLIKTQYGFEVDDRRSKSAACDDAMAFASTIQPKEGERFVLVSAFGAWDTWGDNKKSDIFMYNAIHGLYPDDVPPDFFKKYAHRIPKKYGITCFPSVFDDNGNQIDGGNSFHEHVNRARDYFGAPYNPRNVKDVRCGYILKAFWNPKMRRVELIQSVFQHKLPHIVRAIDAGEEVGISMACDIPFDRCYICGNIAVRDSDYCNHLNRMFIRRGDIMSSGKVAGMINDFPMYFDSSFVAVPAAVEGAVLTKIASYDNPEDETYIFNQDFGFVQKTANYGSYNSNSPMENELKEAVYPDIYDRGYEDYALESGCNVLPSEMDMQSVRLNEEPFSMSVIHRLRDIPLERLCPYLGCLGMYPTGQDFANLMYELPNYIAEIVGKEVELQLLPIIKRIKRLIPNTSYTNEPAMKKASEIPSDFRFYEDEFNSVVNVTKDYLPLKSYFPEYLEQRIQLKTASVSPSDINHLSVQAKEILLTRMILDKDMASTLAVLLRTPIVVSVLKQRGVIPDGSELTMPIYPNDSKSFLESALEQDRNKYYNGIID